MNKLNQLFTTDHDIFTFNTTKELSFKESKRKDLLFLSLLIKKKGGGNIIKAKKKK
jgi:hypothetical protein